MNQVNQTPIIEAGVKSLLNIVTSVKRLQELRPVLEEYPGPPYCIISTGEIPTLVEQICHWQASAFSCLFDRGPRRNETARWRNLRLERVERVLKACEGLSITELSNRRFRNAVAHFDEYLLKELADHPNSSRIQDLSVSHEAAFNFEGRVCKVRYYVFEIDTVHLFDRVLHPLALGIEAESVLNRLGAKIDEPTD